MDSTYNNYELIQSPWCYKRQSPISKITIHHAASVKASAKDIASCFLGTRRASANYCIGYNGEIVVSVPENLVALTSSSYGNDSVAVTIECANSVGAPEWRISPATYDTLLKLCADIAIRNGFSELKYTGDKDGSLTVHRMFDRTECPGSYIMSKLPEICAYVNKEIRRANGMYDSLDEVPAWARATIQKLLNKDLLQGTEQGLGLTKEMTRIFVVLDRAGLFDR